jgi:ornithine cyclodeaminase
LALLSAATLQRHATPALALAAVRRAFIELDAGRAQLFPVAAGQGAEAGCLVNIKGGVGEGARVGVKVGTYWPGNPAQGLPSHGATTLLLDPATGRAQALLNVSRLNGLRTAAADAAAVQALAREDAQVLAVLGAGQQAAHEVRALCQVRPLRQVWLWSRQRERAAQLAEALAPLTDEHPGLRIAAADSLTQALAQADLVSTVTPSTAPLFDDGLVRPGTHLSAMGADRVGKQELPLALVARARCVVDHVPQSAAIGEFQHAVREGRLAVADIVPLGAVLTGRVPGRRSRDEITVFDSSGLAVQDIAVAVAALEAAHAAGELVTLDF